MPEAQSKADPDQIVAMIKAVDPGKPLPEVEVPEAIVLRREPQLELDGHAARHDHELIVSTVQ